MKLESLNNHSFKEFQSFEPKNLRQVLGGVFHYRTDSYHISEGVRDGVDDAKWTDNDPVIENGGYVLDAIVDKQTQFEEPPTPEVGDEEVQDPLTGLFYYV